MAKRAKAGPLTEAERKRLVIETETLLTREPEATQGKARLPKEWRSRFLSIFHSLQVRAALAAVHPDHKGAAKVMRDAVALVAKAEQLFGGEFGAIPEGADVDDRRAVAEALHEAVKAVNVASDMVGTFAESDTRRPRPVRLVGRPGIEPGETIYRVAPQEFANRVFREHPDAPTNATAWAHFAVEVGITPAPKKGEWAKPTASWRQAIQRARKSV